MQVDEELVRHVAHLARLELTDAEVAAMAPQLGRILQHVEQVQALAVDEQADPATCDIQALDALRDDTPGETLDLHAVMRQAPATDGAFFVVPKVLGNEAS